MKLIMKIVSIVVILMLFGGEFLFSQWKDISPLSRKEKIYSINVKSRNFDADCNNPYFELDTILAVGWSSSNGAYFLSFDGGRNWTFWTDYTFFPFSGFFTSDNKILVAGYNFIFDNAEVKIFDTFGNQLEIFRFDGEDLNLVKNFFDCLEDKNFYYAVGYGGSIFRFDKINRSWRQIFIDSNIVGTKLKKFNVRNDSVQSSILCLLGGKSFQIPERIYLSNDNFDEWKLLYDFKAISEGAEVYDYHFYEISPDGFPSGYAVGFVFDTLIVWRANSQLRTFEKVFESQTFDQPISIYSFESGKNVVVLLDNGNLLSSSDFGASWRRDDFASAKQLTGGNIFCQSKSDSTYLLRELRFYGYGRDGFISMLNTQQILGVIEIKPETAVFDEIEVYDLLGNLVFREKFGEQTDEKIKKLPSGIYLVAKKFHRYLVEIKVVINF